MDVAEAMYAWAHALGDLPEQVHTPNPASTDATIAVGQRRTVRH